MSCVVKKRSRVWCSLVVALLHIHEFTGPPGVKQIWDVNNSHDARWVSGKPVECLKCVLDCVTSALRRAHNWFFGCVDIYMSGCSLGVRVVSRARSLPADAALLRGVGGAVLTHFSGGFFLDVWHFFNLTGCHCCSLPSVQERKQN